VLLGRGPPLRLDASGWRPEALPGGIRDGFACFGSFGLVLPGSVLYPHSLKCPVSPQTYEPVSDGQLCHRWHPLRCACAKEAPNSRPLPTRSQTPALSILGSEDTASPRRAHARFTCTGSLTRGDCGVCGAEASSIAQATPRQLTARLPTVGLTGLTCASFRAE
jgi:hypothetical protein